MMRHSMLRVENSYLNSGNWKSETGVGVRGHASLVKVIFEGRNFYFLLHWSMDMLCDFGNLL
jgi:hypothetical protein